MRDKSSNLLQKSISLHYGWEYKIISLLGMHVTFVVFHLSLLDSFPSLFIYKFCSISMEMCDDRDECEAHLF